jgi:hypothetical protein
MSIVDMLRFRDAKRSEAARKAIEEARFNLLHAGLSRDCAASLQMLWAAERGIDRGDQENS